MRFLSHAAVLACIVGAVPTVVCAQPTVASWLGGSGEWTDPTQWSTDPEFPNNGTPTGVTYDAIIGLADSTAFILDGFTITIDSLLIGDASAKVLQSGGSLTVLGSTDLGPGTYQIEGGTFTTGTLTGSGSLIFAGNGAGGAVLPGAGSLIIGTGITVTAQSGSTGRIGADDVFFENQGTITIDAPGSSLTIAGLNWRNFGLLQLSEGELRLAGTIESGNLGAFNWTGGDVVVTGTMDNTNFPVMLPAGISGVLALDGGTLAGGIVGGAADRFDTTGDGTLDDITLATQMTIRGATITSVNNLALDDGTIVLTSSSESSKTPTLLFQGTQTFGGTGEVLFDAPASIKGVDGTLTIDEFIVIRSRLSAGMIGTLDDALINHGLILQTVADQRMLVQGSVFDNTGTIRSEAGDITIVNVTNTGTIVADGGGVLLDGEWSNSGMIVVNDSRISLGGMFTTAGIGTIDRTGGVIELVGTLDNTGATLALDADSGSWILGSGAKIIGGMITAEGGAGLAVSDDIPAAPPELNAVTLAAIVDAPQELMIRQGLTFDGGTIRVNTATLTLAGGKQIIDGTGQIEIAGALNSIDPGLITIGANVMIHGRADVNLMDPGLLNLGTIVATTGNFHILNGQIENGGTIFVGAPHSFTTTAGIVNSGMILVERGSTPEVGDPGGVVRVGGGLINSGTIDLGHAMIVDYVAGESPLDSIATQIASGFSDGDWDGPGINSSHAAANFGFGVGYAEASEIFTEFPATFAGHEVDGTTVVLLLTRYGDADLDGTVTIMDFNRLTENFGLAERHWSDGDFNYDGVVNLIDFNRMAGQFGLSAASGGPTPGDWAALAGAIPEPGMLSLMLLSPMLLRRKR